MSKHTLSCLAVIAVASMASFSSPVGARALEQAAPPPQAPTIIPLKVDVTIMRFEGEKKVSNLPYMLLVNASSRSSGSTSMSMGAQVPIPVASSEGKPSWQYRQIGTSINCSAMALENGRYQLTLGVEDSSLVPDQGRGGAASGVPTFKNFNSQTWPILRDGQTIQFVAATDKISGETVKIEVTVNTIK